MILNRLIRIAHLLDKKGLYEDASIVDSLCKVAIDYPEDFDPGPMPPPEDWEMEMMYEDMAPEVVEKEKEYKQKEVLSKPEEIEELIFRTRALLDADEFPEGGADVPDWDILMPDFGYPGPRDDD